MVGPVGEHGVGGPEERCVDPAAAIDDFEAIGHGGLAALCVAHDDVVEARLDAGQVEGGVEVDRVGGPQEGGGGLEARVVEEAGRDGAVELGAGDLEGEVAGVAADAVGLVEHRELDEAGLDGVAGVGGVLAVAVGQNVVGAGLGHGHDQALVGRERVRECEVECGSRRHRLVAEEQLVGRRGGVAVERHEQGFAGAHLHAIVDRLALAEGVGVGHVEHQFLGVHADLVGPDVGVVGVVGLEHVVAHVGADDHAVVAWHDAGHCAEDILLVGSVRQHVAVALEAGEERVVGVPLVVGREIDGIVPGAVGDVVAEVLRHEADHRVLAGSGIGRDVGDGGDGEVHGGDEGDLHRVGVVGDVVVLALELIDGIAAVGDDEEVARPADALWGSERLLPGVGVEGVEAAGVPEAAEEEVAPGLEHLVGREVDGIDPLALGAGAVVGDGPREVERGAAVGVVGCVHRHGQVGHSGEGDREGVEGFVVLLVRLGDDVAAVGVCDDEEVATEVERDHEFGRCRVVLLPVQCLGMRGVACAEDAVDVAVREGDIVGGVEGVLGQHDGIVPRFGVGVAHAGVLHRPGDGDGLAGVGGGGSIEVCDFEVAGVLDNRDRRRGRGVVVLVVLLVDVVEASGVGVGLDEELVVALVVHGDLDKLGLGVGFACVEEAAVVVFEQFAAPEALGVEDVGPGGDCGIACALVGDPPGDGDHIACDGGGGDVGPLCDEVGGSGVDVDPAAAPRRVVVVVQFEDLVLRVAVYEQVEVALEAVGHGEGDGFLVEPAGPDGADVHHRAQEHVVGSAQLVVQRQVEGVLPRRRVDRRGAGALVGHPIGEGQVVAGQSIGGHGGEVGHEVGRGGEVNGGGHGVEAVVVALEAVLEDV